MKKLGLKDQQRIWEEEHFKQKTFAKIHTDLPSKPVLEFTKFLKKQYPRQTIRVVDIGCGKGRNSRYLASQGFEAKINTSFKFLQPAKSWCSSL